MKRSWRPLLGILLSAGFLWWTLRKIEFADVARELSRSNIPLLVVAALVGTMIFPLRARRWRTILEPVASRVPLGALWRATAVGMMLNNVAPARLGELARGYVITREEPRVSFPAAFASLAVDRVFDAVVIMLLMFGAMLSPAFPAGAQIAGRPASQLLGGWGTLALLVLLASLYLIAAFPDRMIALYELFARRVAPRFEARGRDALHAFSAGLGVLKSPARFAEVLFWTVLHWLVNALAFWIGFRAVGIDAPFSAALFLQGLIALGVALPQAPGFFGVFEALAKLGLAIYGIGATAAVTWAIGLHVLSFIPITVIGAWYFLRMGLRMDDVRGAGRDAAEVAPSVTAA